MFYQSRQFSPERLPGDVSRKIGARGGTMMLAEVTFAQPSAEPPSLHSHPHEQVSYVAQGRIVFFLGEESRQLEAGDSVYCPGGVPHGVQPLTPGAVVLDIFHPLREDLLG